MSRAPFAPLEGLNGFSTRLSKLINRSRQAMYGDNGCTPQFFFSSRRRHTRCSRDWSSDVCSSDLFGAMRYAGGELPDRFELGPVLPAQPRFAGKSAGDGSPQRLRAAARLALQPFQSDSDRKSVV